MKIVIPATVSVISFGAYSAIDLSSTAEQLMLVVGIFTLLMTCMIGAADFWDRGQKAHNNGFIWRICFIISVFIAVISLVILLNIVPILWSGIINASILEPDVVEDEPDIVPTPLPPPVPPAPPVPEEDVPPPEEKDPLGPDSFEVKPICFGNGIRFDCFHIVQPGETLVLIARIRYRVRGQEQKRAAEFICKANWDFLKAQFHKQVHPDEREKNWDNNPCNFIEKGNQLFIPPIDELE